MKIAIPLVAGRLSSHFGHCEQFALIETEPATRRALAQSIVTPPPHEPMRLPRWLLEQGVSVVISGGMGRLARDLLAENHIAIKGGVAGETPENLVRAFLDGELAHEIAPCEHHGHHHDHGQ